MKKLIFITMGLFVLLLCPGCSNHLISPDASTSATAVITPLAENVCVRAGTEPDGEILLDNTTMEGFMASSDYTDEMPYGFALVLTNDGKKSFRTATRNLAKDKSPITLWAGDEAICSPVITSMLNTNYVILSIASVTDDISYQRTVDLLSAPIE